MLYNKTVQWQINLNFELLLTIPIREICFTSIVSQINKQFITIVVCGKVVQLIEFD